MLKHKRITLTFRLGDGDVNKPGLQAGEGKLTTPAFRTKMEMSITPPSERRKKGNNPGLQDEDGNVNNPGLQAGK